MKCSSCEKDIPIRSIEKSIFQCPFCQNEYNITFFEALQGNNLLSPPKGSYFLLKQGHPTLVTRFGIQYPLKNIVPVLTLLLSILALLLFILFKVDFGINTLFLSFSIFFILIGIWEFSVLIAGHYQLLFEGDFLMIRKGFTHLYRTQKIENQSIVKVSKDAAFAATIEINIWYQPKNRTATIRYLDEENFEFWYNYLVKMIVLKGGLKDYQKFTLERKRIQEEIKKLEKEINARQQGNNTSNEEA